MAAVAPLTSAGFSYKLRELRLKTPEIITIIVLRFNPLDIRKSRLAMWAPYLERLGALSSPSPRLCAFVDVVTVPKAFLTDTVTIRTVFTG